VYFTLNQFHKILLQFMHEASTDKSKSNNKYSEGNGDKIAE